MFDRLSCRAAAMLVAAALSGCGGGDASSPNSVLPSPDSVRVSAEHCTEPAASAGAYHLIPGGCVRSSPVMRQAASAHAVDARAPALTATQLMDWAENQYADLLPKAGRTEGYSAPYTYRCYPATKNCLGVTTGESNPSIYVYGPAAGGGLQRVGALVDYTCVVLPQSCVMSVAPAALSMQALEGGTQQADLVVTVPAVGNGTWSVKVDASSPAPWLGASAVDAYTVRVNVSAGELAASSTRSGALLVTYSPTSGASSTLRIPVNLTVVQGLIGPPAQAKTLDANSTAASLSGSVDVVRDDGVSALWSATSSAPWLVLSTTSGVNPSSLGYSINSNATADLANLAEHTAVVTLTAAGLRPVSFSVTLRKNQPYLTSAMPQGIPAGQKTRVVVTGGGFSQYASLTTALKITGGTASNVQKVSDTQFRVDITPSSAGSNTLSLSKAVTGAGGQTKVHATNADPYLASAATHSGDDYVYYYVHDPVRQAIYGLSWFGNALYKYQYNLGGWSVSALGVTGGRNLGLAPDGSRLFIVTENALKVVDPGTMKVLATYPTTFQINSSYGGPLAVSADNRLWLPGSYHSGRMMYLNLLDNSINQLAGGQSIESASFTGSADGSTLVVGPDYTSSPPQNWHKYSAADGSVTNPMGSTQFWHDPRLSGDGTKLLMQQSGMLYNRDYELLGQLPAAINNEFWVRTALTPDGSKILALVAHGSEATRIDIFSTSDLTPGTTYFQKIGSIPVTQQSADCGYQGAYGCLSYGYLIASMDNKAVFLAGNRKVQVFKLP